MLLRLNTKTGPNSSLPQLQSYPPSMNGAHPSTQHRPTPTGTRAWGPIVCPARSRSLAVSHLTSPHKAEDLEGGAWGLRCCVADPRLMLTQQQVPSENPSSGKISISKGSQEVPRRSDSPYCVMSAIRCSNRCWEGLAKGQTDRHGSSVSRLRPPHRGLCSHETMLAEQLCSYFATCTPLLGSSQPPSGAAALQIRR